MVAAASVGLGLTQQLLWSKYTGAQSIYYHPNGLQRGCWCDAGIGHADN